MSKFNRNLKLRKAITGYKNVTPIHGSSDTYSIQTNVAATEADVRNSNGDVVATPVGSNLKALTERIKEGLIGLGVKFPMITITSTAFLTFERQLVTFSSVPNTGSFKLVYSAVQTSLIPYSASASDVQTALRAIAGLSDVLVTGNFTSGFLVDFRSVPGNLSNMTTANNTLAVLHDVKKLVGFSTVPASGTYKLSYNSILTSTLNWNDNAATVQTAVRAISGLSAATVTGDTTAGFTVTFVGMTSIATFTSANNTLQDSVPAAVTINISDTTVAPTSVTPAVAESAAGQ